METWYSVFVSPTNNIHYFTLELPERLEENQTTKEATMTLLADRSHHARGSHDGGLLSVTYRVSAEIHGPFFAVMAKDSKDPSDGLNVMILKREMKNGVETLEGIFSWNSLTSGTIKSAPIIWTLLQSKSHRRMTQP
jgi:hypothetical protein